MRDAEDATVAVEGRRAEMRDTFHAATAPELQAHGALRRASALVDQRRLFPHHGEIVLSGDRLRLGSWRTLAPSDVTDVSHRFPDGYGRFAAGGARGGFPSLGAIGRGGAPLVLDLATGERIVLLVGFRWLSGLTRDADWLPVLRDFASGSPRDPH
jgi:hypothetical protein